ncbi:MAG: hypothetical protein PHI35_08605, partial [Victivallaceae bacterium]|nr:hypothetical protein [Victivallaceae bacterium]
PAIANFDPIDFPETFSNKRYAVLVIKAAPDRGLSIYDYELEILGVGYPCVAIRMDNAEFDAAPDKREIARTSPYRTYTMLFIVNGGFVGLQPREMLSLRCVAPSKGRSLQPVPFVNLGDRAFTPPPDIPSDGIMALGEPRR